LVSSNASDIQIVQSWLPGTDVEAALLRVRELEKEAEKIKRELLSAKHALARAMRD
jgi:hypothetical protein